MVRRSPPIVRFSSVNIRSGFCGGAGVKRGGRKWIRRRPRHSRRVPRDPERSTWAREWRYPACVERSLKCRCWSSKRPRRGKPRGEKNCKSMFSHFIPNFLFSFIDLGLVSGSFHGRSNRAFEERETRIFFSCF